MILLSSEQLEQMSETITNVRAMEISKESDFKSSEETMMGLSVLLLSSKLPLWRVECEIPTLDYSYLYKCTHSSYIAVQLDFYTFSCWSFYKKIRDDYINYWEMYRKKENNNVDLMFKGLFISN